MTALPKLAAPAQRALAAARISSLEQLAKKRRDEIAALHGIGANALRQLDSALDAAGLKFAE